MSRMLSKPESFTAHLEKGDYDAVFPLGGTVLALAVSLATLAIAV